MAPRTEYAQSRDGVFIAYQAVGDGPRDLVYVPQSFSALEVFWEHPTVSRFFDRLAALGRLILFDRRGSGMSDRAGPPATLEEQVDDVRAVLDAAGSERASLFAIMEGGPMAMLAAASMPERVEALVLYATFAKTTWAEDYAFARTHQERDESMAIFFEHWGDGTFATEVFAPGLRDDPTLGEWLGRLQRLGMGRGDAAANARLNGHLDLRHLLGSIRVPTLLLHRTGDTGFDIRHMRYLEEHIPDARLVELPGGQTLPFLGDTEALLGEIEEFLTGDRRMPDTDRVLATVLFTDIVGSTERAAALGDEPWRDLLSAHDRVVRTSLSRHRGREVKSVGDGFLATFDGPARAVRAAQSMAEGVDGLGLRLRAGLHCGEIEMIGEDVGGLAVHIAARVMSEAQPGEVLVSGTVKDLVVGSGLEFEERGRRVLRGVPGEWALWAARA
jgi:class 3 adenylate cyclase